MQNQLPLSPERRSLLKAYCQLDDELTPAEEVLLERFYWSAQSYMHEAGIQIPPGGTTMAAMYDQCVDALVLANWDHRGSHISITVLPENPAWRRDFNNLKFANRKYSWS